MAARRHSLLPTPELRTGKSRWTFHGTASWPRARQTRLATKKRLATRSIFDEMNRFCWSSYSLQPARDLLIAALLALFGSGVSIGGAAEGRGFTDATKSSGIGDAIARQYERHPNWWLSGLNLVDLDGDGLLDLFFAAHGAGRSLAMRGDGQGHFMIAEGSYPASEIHLPYDINEDGKLDLQMTWQDGGGRWWLNPLMPGQLNFRGRPSA